MKHSIIARKIYVTGIVQGVGFRPFIYQLARTHDLNGVVANTASGVSIHVEGAVEQVALFFRHIAELKPSLAHITDIASEDVMPEGYADFTISESRRQAQRSTLISPDVATCEDCIREIFDPLDRRFGYPFTNCTNCGPRYTIIDDIPYDRPNTSMKHFVMCALCRAEYDDPYNRRFHAQPNACPVCGPVLTLHDSDGGVLETAGEAGGSDLIRTAVRLLKGGHILAVKGLGGFHLAVDAENPDAVARLRRKKCREEKPLALMAASPDDIRLFARVGPAEEALLRGFQRPIVLLEKRRPHTIAENVSPENRYFGVMLPATPLHYLMMNSEMSAIVMTSGNMSEEPIAIDNADAVLRLNGIADYYLTHNRDIRLRSDDSIVRPIGGAGRLVRRSRGYVPVPVFLRNNVPCILACGGALKNTVCLTKDNNAFLSQHIGDLENLRTLEFFTSTIDHMKRILDIEPRLIAHDMHPDYLGTRYAIEQTGAGQIAVPVQHHHAHIVSCMAENRIGGDVIGLAFDGTGYGMDGHIWGGEVLVASENTFERTAHMAYVPMPGGDAAAKAPWRMGVSYLYDAMGDGFREVDSPLFENTAEKDVDIVVRMIARNFNSPLTSSLGRLFDAVAAILGIRSHVYFEGQAAMALEMAACPDSILPEPSDVYSYALPQAFSGAFQPNAGAPIPSRPIIMGVVRDMAQGRDVSCISTRFHWTLIHLFSDVCDRIRGITGLNRVVLSGGVFQNAILLAGMDRMLTERHFDVYTHRRVPANDGGISLGQAVVAAHAVDQKPESQD